MVGVAAVLSGVLLASGSAATHRTYARSFNWPGRQGNQLLDHAGEAPWYDRLLHHVSPAADGHALRRRPRSRLLRDEGRRGMSLQPGRRLSAHARLRSISCARTVPLHIAPFLINPFGYQERSDVQRNGPSATDRP